MLPATIAVVGSYQIHTVYQFFGTGLTDGAPILIDAWACAWILRHRNSFGKMTAKAVWAFGAPANYAALCVVSEVFVIIWGETNILLRRLARCPSF